MLKTPVVLALIIGFILLSFSAVKWTNNYYERKKYGVAPGVVLEGINMEGYLYKEVSQIVELLAIEKEREMQNAGINKKTGEIVPSNTGIAVDQERTIGLVLNSPAHTSLELITYLIEPQVTTQDIKSLNKVLGSYTTWFSGSSERYQNVKIAIDAINNTLLLPNELFSFNLTTGPRSVNKGYRMAPIISGGAFALGTGGGVCQVSSTLYNAALRSNLKIVERHPHSKRVRYVPENRDAAVSYGSKDLKFLNSLNGPVLVKASLNGSRVEVWILGKEE